jgi:hypothetical protein
MIGLSLLFVISCGDDKVEEKNDPIENSSPPPPTEEELEANRVDSLKNYYSDRFPDIGYRKVYVENDSVLRYIRDNFGKSKDENAYYALITMNRCEFRYIGIGDSVILPDSVVEDVRAYSVLPHFYPSAESLDKLIIVSNEYQCYGAYENGVLVRFSAANTGKEKTQTYPGRYALNWKARKRISSVNSEWELPFNFNFHRLAGNAFHQFAMPGRPVSHSCVRQFREDAEWLFNWGEQADYENQAPIPFTGTLVLIIDAFDFNRKNYGPWVDLKSNKFKITDMPDDPENYYLPFIPIEQVPKPSRGIISKEDRPRYENALDSLYARGTLREGVNIIPSIDYNKLREEKAKKKAAEEEAKKKAKEEAKEELPEDQLEDQKKDTESQKSNTKQSTQPSDFQEQLILEVEESKKENERKTKEKKK